MSLTLFLCEVEESEKGWLFKASLSSSSFALNFRQVHGAQVALLQSPILRLLHGDFNSAIAPSQKPSSDSVTTRPKCVTYVLSQECYRCPDCASRPSNSNIPPTSFQQRAPIPQRASCSTNWPKCASTNSTNSSPTPSGMSSKRGPTQFVRSWIKLKRNSGCKSYVLPRVLAPRPMPTGSVPSPEGTERE